MYLGRTVFAQVMDTLPLRRFHTCVNRYDGNHKVKAFTCLDQFRVMAFAQLTYRESLRDIEACLRAMQPKLYHMGIRSTVSRNTLANANQVRDWRIYADEDFGQELAQATLYALDASTIDLCLSLFPWAHFRRTKAAIKLHTLMDLRGSIPTFIHVSEGNLHDVNALDLLIPEAGAFYIMDRGYLDFARLSTLDQASAFFVTRAKSNFNYRRRYSRAVDKTTGLVCDQTVVLATAATSRAYLRPSNIDPAKHSRAILKLLVDKLRRAFPGVKIIFRGDSGFCRWKLMRWCDRHDVHYILGLSRNRRLEAMSQSFMDKAEADYEATGLKQRQFHMIDYAAGSWDRPRKVIVKAERLHEGPNLRLIVTNLPPEVGDAQRLYDDLYCARGEMENRIKEQQLGLFADRTSSSTMLANQFRLLLSSAAYVLMQTLRRVVLAGTQLARAQVSTIRTKLIKIAARLVVSARRVVLHLSSSCPLQPLFRQLAHRLAALSFDTG